MAPAVQEMVAATYVRDIGASRRFYELLGFHEHSRGETATSAWLALRHDSHEVLLTSTTPPLELPQLPLLFYFYFDDVDAAVEVIRAGGFEVLQLGYPPHALGGEAKVLDPDGNTVLLGQRERAASQPPPVKEDTSSAVCQVRDIDGKRCRQEARVKLADAAGNSTLACLDHADEILVTVRGAFVASPGDEGISGYLSRRWT
jgi:catechol 2,3-dioxygenase-like lactoylglutathione lyase family enzyme